MSRGFESPIQTSPAVQTRADGESPDTKPSSNQVVVSVRSVGKVYRLYDRPQDRLKHMLFSRVGRSYGHPFWALSDVSLEVRRGEVVGLIGRNGSGKSTLLQIIAGILQPAAGELEICGQLAALLGLGSGFNPDYTGRARILMIGPIPGIPPDAVARRLDDIVAFADIGEFIDQPVKTYSTGMFVRLAFSVTTSVDADVLLIDEALAVGDVFFRQKCYRRLETLRARGVSIVLASHAMTEVEQFCQRALLLHDGRVAFQGSASEAVKRYYLIEQLGRFMELDDPSAPASAPDGADARETGKYWPAPEAFLDLSRAAQVSNGWARCVGVALCDSNGRPCNGFEQGETATFFYEFELLADIAVPEGGVELSNDKGVIVHGKNTLQYGSEVPRKVRRGSRLRFQQDIALELAVGEYTFTISLGALDGQDYDRGALYPHLELDARVIRLCMVPAAGSFAVVLRAAGEPIQLLHHGVANLPGRCLVSVAAAETHEASSGRITSGSTSPLGTS